MAPQRLLLALFVIAMAACGGTQIPAPVAPMAPPKTVCRDWLHDASGGVVWRPNQDRDGIRTLLGDVRGSDFIAFRGVGIIDAPIAKVATVLTDVTRHSEWVPHFGGMRIVRHISETEKVIYRHVTTPFIISDRDFVAKVVIQEDEAPGHMLVEFSSVLDPREPEYEDKVRGVLHQSGYRMWPIDGGARTMMVFTIHVDPKGNVPAWIVNRFQSGYARSNIQNIRRQAAKPDVEENPRVKAAFEGKKPRCGLLP
jgi:hypothetical protein